MTTSIQRTFQVGYPIDMVWANLSDPEKIVSCVPGASLNEKVDDNTFKGHVEMKFGPVKAGYDGLVNFLQRDPATRTISLKGTGTDTKGKGSAEMTMNGHLEQKDQGTEVTVSMNINIVGMLAQFGSRLISDVSNQVFDQFVTNFNAMLSGGTVQHDLSAGSLVGGVFKGIFGSNKSK